jgi:hypothetical protein
MAKKREEMTAAEQREQAMLEANVSRQERAEREATVDERVAAAIGQHPEPVEVLALTAAAQFLVEAREAQAVFQKGDPIAPDVLKSLVSRAVGLVAASEEKAVKA